MSADDHTPPQGQEPAAPDTPVPLMAPPFVAVGARRAPSDHRGPEELRAALREAVRLLRPDPEAMTQLVDAAAVAGERHLAAALARAARARAKGRAHLSDPGAEFLLYLAGSDQFPEAVQRAGVRAETREVVLVLSPPGPLHGLLVRAGLEEDPSVYPRPPTEEVLARLGLDPAAHERVPRGSWELLAIEAGAMVELPRGGGAKRGKG